MQTHIPSILYLARAAIAALILVSTTAPCHATNTTIDPATSITLLWLLQRFTRLGITPPPELKTIYSLLMFDQISIAQTTLDTCKSEVNRLIVENQTALGLPSLDAFITIIAQHYQAAQGMKKS